MISKAYPLFAKSAFVETPTFPPPQAKKTFCDFLNLSFYASIENAPKHAHRCFMGAYCCIPSYVFRHLLPSRAFHTWPQFTVVILTRSYLPKSLLKCQFAGNNACKSIIKPPPSGNYVKQMKPVKFSQRWKFLSGCLAELQMISTRCNFFLPFAAKAVFPGMCFSSM